jgi:hypothetical protein
LRDPISKIPNTKKGWWSGSSRRAPAEQVWGSEFKHQHNHNNNKKEFGLDMLTLRCHLDKKEVICISVIFIIEVVIEIIR